MARQNQDIYLTWDHMDVYFATSMRKKWEFEDLFDFVNGLMADPRLAALNLRHFDPTQAFTRDRVDKGLVESLMLKRAKCTVYSVQDTDTLGKDSELAATLAQGKPVIAYVPTVDIETRTHQLAQEDPSTVQDRLRFVLYADDRFAQSISSDDYDSCAASGRSSRSRPTGSGGPSPTRRPSTHSELLTGPTSCDCAGSSRHRKRDL